jgi:AhpD family alkylhydroperoxidase
MLSSLLLSISHTILKWFLRRKVAQFERVNHYDMGYARSILEANPRAMLALHRAGALAQYRGPLSATARYGIKLVAALHEDCGPCLQLCVSMALAAGVPRETIASVICREPTRDPDTDLVVNFARAVLAKEVEETELRERVVARFGQDGLTTVAFALTGTRMYPMLKAVLGYAECYPIVTVGTESIDLRATAPLTPAPS